MKSPQNTTSFHLDELRRVRKLSAVSSANEPAKSGDRGSSRRSGQPLRQRTLPARAEVIQYFDGRGTGTKKRLLGWYADFLVERVWNENREVENVWQRPPSFSPFEQLRQTIAAFDACDSGSGRGSISAKNEINAVPNKDANIISH